MDDLRPEQWLDVFYENRKGSGKSGHGRIANQPRSVVT